MPRIFTRICIGLAGLLLAEGTASACSCLLGASNDETKRHFVRRIVISAAIIGRFEVVEQADHARRRGELVRPVEVYAGRARRSYRLKYSEDPCGSSFETSRITVLYRPQRYADDLPEQGAEERLAVRLEQAVEKPGRRARLASVRRAIAARRPDAPSATYADGGICSQLFLRDAGMLEMLREEAANAGRG